MKTWRINPLGLSNVQLEVSEESPQGYLACGNQAIMATLLFAPWMSAPKRRIDHPAIENVSWVQTIVRQASFTLLVNLMLRH